MATIDQPKPSSPGSPQPDQQPLQPGGPERSGTNTARVSRPNPRTPEKTEREIHGERD
jgi:hypothetical protein